MGLEEILPEGDTDKLLMDCYYCHDRSMVHLHYNKKDNWSMYQCVNKECDKTYLMDWDKKDNWFKQQKNMGDDYEKGNDRPT